MKYSSLYRSRFLTLVIFYSMMFVIVYTVRIGFVSPLIPIIGIVFYYFLCNSSKGRLYFDMKITKTINFVGIYTLLSLLFTLKIDYQSIVWYASDKYLLLPYACVFLGIINFNKSIISDIPKVLSFSSLIFLLILLIYRNDIFVYDYYDIKDGFSKNYLSIDTISKEFCFCSGFLLLVSPFVKKYRLLLVFIAFTICFLLSIFMARRNLIVTSLLFLFFFLYSKITSSQTRTISKFLIFIFVGILASCLFVIFSNVISGTSNITFLENLTFRMSSFESDGRFIVQDYLFSDLNKTPIYWFLGKGINGGYYCPGYSESGFRNIIETGFLQVILRIGIIGLFCYIFIIFRTIRISFHGNSFVKASSYYIIIYSIQMLYAGVPAFDLGWVLFWILISMCNNPNIQNMSDNELKTLLWQ